jgi:N-acetylneuraminate synthase
MSLYLIAEIGINHNGDMNIAKELIKFSSEAGFDAVKFQKRSIDVVYEHNYLASYRESPWGDTQRAQKEGLEFSEEDYKEINNYCNELKIDWTASAWDLDSQSFINKFNVPFNKVASPMLGHKPLLSMISKENKKAFISTGMSTIEELDDVVNLFVKENCEFELMHCNSTYPLKEEDANLLCIPMLRDRYNCNVGYSGHESSLIKVCVAAVTLGATSLERHITLDRAMYGSDQSASIEAHSLKGFVETVRRVPLIMGTGKKVLNEAERVARDKLRIER